MTGWKQSYNEEKFSAKSPEDLESIQREVVSCKFDFRVNEFLHIKQFPFEKSEIQIGVVSLRIRL